MHCLMKKIGICVYAVDVIYGETVKLFEKYLLVYYIVCRVFNVYNCDVCSCKFFFHYKGCDADIIGFVNQWTYYTLSECYC